VPFRAPADVVVKQLDDTNWEVREALEYAGLRQEWTVPVGSGTDFASVPRVFVWFLPRYGRYTRAAILHDHLWRRCAATGQMRWVDADGVFRRAMRELGVPFLRRWMMWSAVRWAALLKPRGREGWLSEAPRVLLFTLLGAPFVVPAAVIIVASLALFWLVEWLVYVPLRVGEVVQRRVLHRSPKRVNAPHLDALRST
jgi:hypothetical protein